ncbi:monoamine oxidase [Scopulibacillus darangshiensis]|uniref:Monoamine oxidase n=1 Tax=Scopulibacillus darangshiensis TaxID=442528 RepID=A0A4R2P5R8_9BACL|nr:monoamine oxidase [Scopulibacillus darangshiensis]
MADYKPSSLSYEEMLFTIRQGLRPTQLPKKIIVAGAGMAGLVAASLLKKAGHSVTILEANDRIGGRVYTLRYPFVDDLYLDVGAMRIPNTHHLVLAYLEKFRLPINEFKNTTPQDLIYANGIKTNLRTYWQNPDILKYPVAPHEKGKTAEELLLSAIKPVIDFIQQDPLNNWPVVLKRFDSYSMGDFLRYNPVGASLSPGALEMVEVIIDLEGFLELAFTSILREFLPLLNLNMSYYEVEGGNDRLPKAFIPYLKEDILLGHRMTKIRHHNDGKVTIRATQTTSLRQLEFTADLAIVTVPFSVLSIIDIEPRHTFSHNKYKAIRELHYASSTKIGLQFTHRFWEKEGLRGGKLITDMPIRFAYYPSHLIGSSGSGIILASYTWEDDTLPWDSLPESSRIRHALDNLATVHGNSIYDAFLTGASQSWAHDRFTGGGAFSLFKPSQQTELFPYIYAPEGSVHFAGDHTSTLPAWMEGAIQSGIRVAHEINDLPRR